MLIPLVLLDAFGDLWNLITHIFAWLNNTRGEFCLVKLPLSANKLASYIVTSRDVRGIPHQQRASPRLKAPLQK